MIGGIGTFLGVALGYGVCLLIQRYQFIELPKDVFLISTVPVRIYLSNFSLVAWRLFLDLPSCQHLSRAPSGEARPGGNPSL